MPEIIGNPDELVSAVAHEARNQVREIEKEAEKRAEKIRSDAEAEADRRKEEILSRAREKARKKKKERKMEVSRENKESFLKARQELIDDAWKRAEEKLLELKKSKEDYLAVLEGIAIDAAGILGPGKRVLSSDPDGHKLLTDKRLKSWSRKAADKLGKSVSFSRSSEPEDISGGLVVREKDGRRQVNASFSARLDAAREEIAHRVMERLMGNE